MSETLLTVLIGVAMLLGLLAVFIPLMPEMPILWGAALAYGLLVGWGRWGPWLFGLITLLGIVGGLAEIWVSSAGGKRAGASLWGILGGLAAGFLGFLIFPPLGGVIGLLLGTFAVEAIRLKDADKAARAMLGMGLGYGASFGVRLIVGVLMVGVWLAWVIAG
jgi:uncharacterized protein YqgC (DUF456 family)